MNEDESSDDDSDPSGDEGLTAMTVDGDETVYVSRTEGERGSLAPFMIVYRTPDRQRRYGWFCANCESFDNAMDSMGRIECNDCPNFRKPTEWDAAHE